MSICHYVTGTRGSGKSLFAVTQAIKRLKNGCKVASNLDIYPDSHVSHDYELYRLPDIPDAVHFHQVGFGCDPKFLTKEHYDKSKFGLLILDEISLFLSSKRDGDFKGLMRWLVQSRKFGWDLMLLAQTKDQVEDSVFKALCDNLVICQSDARISIPFFGKILRFFGLSGMMPDKHTAMVLGGRTEQHEIIDTIPYSRRGFDTCYNTAQQFFDDELYHLDENIDMRAVYRVIPGYVSSGQKLIDGYQRCIDKVKNTLTKYDEVAPMHKSHNQQALFIKIGLLVSFLIIFLVFNSPFDNKLLSDDSEPQTEVSPVVPQVIQQAYADPIPQSYMPEVDVFMAMIDGAELSVPLFRHSERLQATIEIRTDTQSQFISLDDLRVLGWYSVKVGNVLILKKGKNQVQIPMSVQTLKHKT